MAASAGPEIERLISLLAKLPGDDAPVTIVEFVAL